MENFHIHQPVAKGKPKVDKIDIFIGLLGFGKENAVKRDDLTARCVEVGLISKDTKDKDRSMRNLLKRAKIDYNITNDADGEGYYRPTKREEKQFEQNHNRERKKGISTLVGEKYNGAAIEDFKHGRMAGE